MTRPTRASGQDNDLTDFPVPLLPKPDNDEEPISLTLVRSALDLVWYRITRRVTKPRSGRKPTTVIKRILSEATAMSFRRRDHGALA
jgi:hypothetical protein